MNRLLAAFVLPLVFVPLQCLGESPTTSAVDTLTHLYTHQIVLKKRIPIDPNDGEYGYLNPIFSPDLKRYAVTTDSATTPSAPTNVTVRYIGGGRSLVLNPRPDNDITKRTVKLLDGGADAYLNYIGPCEWSPDGAKLLITGRGPSDQNWSLWCIEVTKMQGIPISHLGNGQSVGGAGFSPDGKRIAYTVYSGKHKNETQLFLANADGSQTRKLGPGSAGEWSPDSKYLLTADRRSLSIVDTEDGHTHTVFPSTLTPGHSLPKFLHIAKADWLDEGHLAITVTTGELPNRVDYDVWILDDHGKLMQTLPSVRVHQAWAAIRTIVLYGDASDGKPGYWQIKFS